MKHIFILSLALLGAIALFSAGVFYPFSKERDWVQEALDQDLRPCFNDPLMAKLHVAQFERDLDLTEEQRQERAERIIPSGAYEGYIVPEDCFAVAQGLGGLMVTFWRRPSDTANSVSDIPYWTPSRY